MDDSEGSESSIRPYHAGGCPAFCEFLYRRTGMSFTEGKRYFIDHRLEDRIAATGSSSFQAYFSLLRADADHEIEHLINSFTVNETYFYREDHQLRCMTSSLLGAIVRAQAAGDRAHLVDPVFDRRRALFRRAMADGKLAPGRQLQYRDCRLGYRYSRAQGGRRGHLRRPRADAAVARIVARYFKPVANGNHQIDEGLRDSIEFTRANMIDAQDMAKYRDFDLIFCRNVLIYFDDASRRQAAENLYDCLRPGG